MNNIEIISGVGLVIHNIYNISSERRYIKNKASREITAISFLTLFDISSTRATIYCNFI